MRVYVANLTKQRQEIYYWAPETEAKSPRMCPIEVGMQTVLPGDFNTPQIDAIVKQLSPYGLVHVKEIKKAKPFVGLCYDIDKPISVDALRLGLIHNNEVLEERGQETRKLAAVAVSQALDNSTDGRLPLTATQVEMKELDRKDGQSGDFEQTIRVSGEAENEGNERGRRRRGRG